MTKISSSIDINNHTTITITSDLLCSLYKIGFKPVSLSEDHEFTIKWGAVYDDPYYWQISDFHNHAVYSKFTNIASTVGKTHLKDSEGKELYLQVLDCDSEYIYDIITKRTIAKLPLEKFHNFYKDCLRTAADGTDFNKSTLFDVLKKITFITKTREPYGLHIWWLSHNQNKPILSLDCKKDYEFEIKTDKSNGLCTLPPSTHREDKGFRYAAIGRTDKLLINDQLYDLLFGLFNESLLNNDNSYKNNKKEQNLIPVEQQQEFSQSIDFTFNDLSSETIKLTVNLLLPFYKEGDRHNFALFFSGTAFHFRVTEKSAGSIIDSICNKTNDVQEKPDRLNTLHSTYQKGLEGKPLTGGPTLTELMCRVNGCDISVAKEVIKDLRKLWLQKIPIEISVARAKRAKSGYVKVKGTAISISPTYHLIKSISSICEICGWQNKKEFKIPKFKVSFKEKINCPKCFEDNNSVDTVNVSCEHVTVVDLEVQDLECYNEIERLPVRVFEKDTFDIASGEVVIIGNLHIVRKNDSTKNKLETFLFADSIESVKRQEITLTEKDIQKIKDWKQHQEDKGINPIDALVALLAPELIDLDHIKKGVLLACVNAGFRNVDIRFPKRIRIHILIIGDPGLAKTSLLQKTLPLIANSHYAGGQSSTGLSLTAQISKEDGGGTYTMRFGPVVLAKDSICLINEIGQLPIDEHKHLLDCMEENDFPIAKYGISTTIEAHPTIIASANPINNKWQNSESISTREFPTLSQIIQRFDLIFILRENTTSSHLSKYVEKRKQISDDYKKGVYEGNEEFLKKCLLYARTFKPELTENAHHILKEFYLNMGKAGISGLPRKIDALIRLTIAIAKLNLKTVADEEDAQDAMLFYNDTLKSMNQADVLAANPRDIAYAEVRKIIQENNGQPILLTEASMEACRKNKDVEYYFLGKETLDRGNVKSNHNNINPEEKDNVVKSKMKLNKSWHLKQVLSLIRNDDSVLVIQEKPVVLRWNKRAEEEQSAIVNYQCNCLMPCDECDECDGQNKNNNLLREIDSSIGPLSNSVKEGGITNNLINDSKDYASKTHICNNKNNNSPIIPISNTDSIKDGNNSSKLKELQKTQLSKQPSHSSHSSHSLMVNSDTTYSPNESRNDNQFGNGEIFEDNNLTKAIPRFTLKHSPYAEVFTDTDTDKKKSQK